MNFKSFSAGALFSLLAGPAFAGSVYIDQIGFSQVSNTTDISQLPSSIEQIMPRVASSLGFLMDYDVPEGGVSLISQHGDTNVASISQTGTYNMGVIMQYGMYNVGSIQQSGSGQRAMIFQSGNNNTAIIRQR